MTLLFALSLAFAGIVAAPPPDAREVGLLLCADDACSDQMFWVTNEPALEDLPILLVDALAAEEAATQASGEGPARSFRLALGAAHAALRAERWGEADRALDDAERALRTWRGTAENGELFSFWYMRGVVSVATGRSDGEAPFTQAAVTAWNRSAAPPEGLEAWAPSYYAAMEELLDAPVGSLVIEADGGPEVALDGVALGPTPTRVLVFPGVHRLTAVQPGTGVEWQASVTVTAARTTTARVRFAGGDDPDWLATALGQAIDSRRLEPAAAELLATWASRHGVRVVRLLRLDPVEAAGADSSQLRFRLREARYEPGLRRFTGRSE